MKETRGINILVADDSATMRMLISVTTKKIYNGIVITEAVNGIDALQKFRERDFDLVFTDFNMPEMDGAQLISRIREADGDIPIVVVTTKGEEKDRDFCLALGANGYITKPVNWRKLHEIVIRFLVERSVHDVDRYSNTARG